VFIDYYGACRNENIVYSKREMCLATLNYEVHIFTEKRRK